jgi:5-methyltetrahydropteroyltriglutamate--homocysteine methyltransferase
VPAMTFSRLTTPAKLRMRSATTSGCSTTLVAWLTTPGTRAFRGRQGAIGVIARCGSRRIRRLAERRRLHVEALNHALAAVPPERVRMHLCWGNYEGPHHCDVPLAEIIDIAFTARPATISFEAANPRHAHEWTLFEQVKLPEGKIIVPGVIESKSNFIEHPELVAQRIARYANLVGRDNVIAGSDCGFGTWVGQAAVDPDVVWAKLSAMAEGARLATKQFWGG